MKMWQIACVALVASPAMGEIVANGSFESGTGSDADSWNQLEIFGGSATSSTDRIGPGFGLPAYDGDAYMRLGVTGASDYGPVSEIQQQTSVGSVNGGEAYNFSFASSGFAGPGTVAFYEVLWFDGDGSNGGGPQGSATGLQTFALGNDWAVTSLTDLVAPEFADSVLIQIRVVTGAFDGANGFAAIDAVSFAQVPAPGALALLGLAGLANGRRRRVD